MYAIKIISGVWTYFYLANEVSYKQIEAKNLEDFYSNIDNGDNVFVVGTVPDKEFEYVKVYLYNSYKEDDYRLLYLLPSAYMYIMQEGKTIEVVRLLELQESVEV